MDSDFCPSLPEDLVEEVRFGLFDSLTFDRHHPILDTLVGYRSAQVLHQLHRWVMANFRSSRNLSGFFRGEWWSAFKPQDLADAIGCSPKSASSALERLVEKGFVIKTTDTSEYRKDHSYRGKAYRINYEKLAEMVVSKFSSLAASAWNTINRCYKAVASWIEGTFDLFRGHQPEAVEVVEPLKPLLPKPVPNSEKDENMNPKDFEAMFSKRTIPPKGKTSGQVRFEDEQRLHRRDVFNANGVGYLLGDSLCECSQEMLLGLEAHLRKLEPELIIPLEVARINRWLNNKCAEIERGGDERSKAIKLIRKIFNAGERELYGIKSTGIESYAVPKVEKIEDLVDRVWSVDDIEVYGPDFVVYWSPGNHTLEEVFDHYRESRQPLTYHCPIRKKDFPVLPNANYDTIHPIKGKNYECI